MWTNPLTRHLYQSQGSGDIAEEGSGSIYAPGERAKGRGKSVSRVCITNIISNSQLWFLALSPHKTGPIKNYSWNGEGLTGSNLLLLESLATGRFWGKENLGP